MSAKVKRAYERGVVDGVAKALRVDCEVGIFADGPTVGIGSVARALAAYREWRKYRTISVPDKHYVSLLRELDYLRGKVVELQTDREDLMRENRELWARRAKEEA